MRISTVTFQQDALGQMETLQADLSKTQNQLGTGKKLNSAADDPAGMAQVNQLNVELSASEQYVTNGNAASSNLQLEEQAMSDATNTLQSARDLAVQANNSSLTAAQRTDIATQLSQQLQDLIAIGNRTDSNGDYLFSGEASGTTPFAQVGNALETTVRRWNDAVGSFDSRLSVTAREIASLSGETIEHPAPVPIESAVRPVMKVETLELQLGSGGAP